MKCSLCKEENITVGIMEGEILNYPLCSFCHWMVSRTVHSMIAGKNVKIQWGNRSISREDWIELKGFISATGATNIVEYGVGLSTELLLLEGYSPVCIDEDKRYSELYSKRLGIDILHCGVKDEVPRLPFVFDLAMVDSPQGKGHRPKCVKHARQHTERFIYMHDPTEEQIREVDMWTPLDTLSKYKGLCRFYASPVEMRYGKKFKKGDY